MKLLFSAICFTIQVVLIENATVEVFVVAFHSLYVNSKNVKSSLVDVDIGQG